MFEYPSSVFTIQVGVNQDAVDYCRPVKSSVTVLLCFRFKGSAICMALKQPTNDKGKCHFLIAVKPEQVHVFTVFLLNQDNKNCPFEDAFKRHTCTPTQSVSFIFAAAIYHHLFEYDLMGFFFMDHDHLIAVHIMTRS